MKISMLPTMLSIVQRFTIAPKAKVKQLSKGNKEKVQLILVMSREAGFVRS